MAYKLYEETSVQDIAAAIREKTGLTKTMTLSEMADIVLEIEGGSGNKGDIKSLIEGSITEISNDEVTNVTYRAFAECRSLENVSFTNCMSIGAQAFNYCTSLTEASFPNCTALDSQAFYQCHSLKSADFPACTLVGTSAFVLCYNMTSVSFQNCTTIGSHAFKQTSSLTSVSFPNCTTIGSVAFALCPSLSEAYFPVCTWIGSQAFYSCWSLMTLVLGGTSVALLSHSNAFRSTPMSNSTYTGTFGSIYVPASLVDSYKAASNWSYYADRITAIVE